MLRIAHLEGEPADLATRSRVVETDADKMLTCWSDSTRVMSESSRARSSASTWMATRNTRLAVGAHSTSIIRSGLGASDRDVGAVPAVHRHAAPPGHEADDLVARHGVQQRASLTHTSLRP